MSKNISDRAAHQALLSYIQRTKHAENLPFAQVAKTLANGHRPLGEKHFREIRAHINQIIEATPLCLYSHFSDNPALPLDDQEISLSRTYFGFMNSPLHVSPSQLQISMRRDFLFASSRILPVVFLKEHVERRHVSRTAHAIQWDSRNGDLQIYLSLAMARVLGKKMGERGETTLPVSIPDHYGLFLGYAAACTEPSFWPEIVSAGRHSGTGKNVAVGLNGPVRPEWSPNALLFLKTYISIAEFSDAQHDLFSAFRSAAVDHPDTPATLDALGMSYIRGFDYEETESDFAKIRLMRDLEVRLEALVSSETWSAANRLSSETPIHKAPLDLKRSL